MTKLLCFCVLATSLAFGKIIETKRLQEILPTLPAGALVVFDLDNTIIQPAQTMGGEEWFDYLVDKYTKEGLSRDKAVDKAMVEWEAVQRVTRVVPVEKDGPMQIAAAQKAGVYTIALTSRMPAMSELTPRQLNSVGIELDQKSVLTPHRGFKVTTKVPYRNGILFAGTENKKGEVLTRFLKVTKFRPSTVVFFDNKLHHVEGMEKAMQALGINFIGCRHGFTDEKIAKFNKETAEVQQRYFGKILDDEAASAIADN